MAGLFTVLLTAAGLRLWFVSAGVPHAVAIDEPQVVDRALRILHTGDWNTHLFDYPSLVIYLHAVIAIARYLWGAVGGEWRSLDALDIRAVYVTGRVTTALIGTATVWMTYRLGAELGSRRVALLGAAQLACHPMHVRESHFVLTDIPVTALTTLAVWLAVRAGKVRRPGIYIGAGAVAGLAAAAKYNGVIALVAIVTVWVIYDRGARDRWRKAAGAIAGAAVAFLVAAPYTLLDLPAFLNGFAAQFSRFAGAARHDDPGWWLYFKHLSLAARYWPPLAMVGAVLVCARRSHRRWLAPLIFVATYYYALSTNAIIFGRYALPLIPVLCLLASVPIVDLIHRSRRWSVRAGRSVPRALFATAVVLMCVPFAIGSVEWLRALRRPDTRDIAAAWMHEHLRAGATLAVENSGPAYLGELGFQVLSTQLLIDHPVDWYRSRVEYFVISSDAEYANYTATGPTVFRIAPSPDRWGPPIRIIQLR